MFPTVHCDNKKEKEYGPWVPWGPKRGMIALVRPSSNVADNQP
jgi:hypothetical protein